MTDARTPRPRYLAGVNDQALRTPPTTSEACPGLSRQLIDWLDRRYPELTGSQNMTDGQLRFALGSRHVVQVLALELARQEKTS